jgi:hypothetical protein
MPCPGRNPGVAYQTLLARLVEQHLMLAFEAAFRVGECLVTPQMVKGAISTT